METSRKRDRTLYMILSAQSSGNAVTPHGVTEAYTPAQARRRALSGGGISSADKGDAFSGLRDQLRRDGKVDVFAVPVKSWQAETVRLVTSERMVVGNE